MCDIVKQTAFQAAPITLSNKQPSRLLQSHCQTNSLLGCSNHIDSTLCGCAGCGACFSWWRCTKYSHHTVGSCTSLRLDRCEGDWAGADVDQSRLLDLC